MSFWLHQRPLVRKLSMLPPRLCYAGAAACGLAGFAFLYYLAIAPIYAAVRVAEQQRQAIEQQVQAFELVLDKVPASQAENKQLLEAKRLCAADIANLQSTVNQLLAIMRKHKVSCRSIVPLCSMQDGLHAKHMVAIRAKGSFEKLVSLLTEFEEPMYPLTLRSVQLSKTRGRLVALDAIAQVISVKEP